VQQRCSDDYQDRASIRVGLVKHIWPTLYFGYDFGKRKNRLQKEVPITIRILLVDDHTVVRKGLWTFLSYDPELEVVGEAPDGNQALTKARELTPDVVLMDLLMPGMDGITATTAIRRELPETEVLALTSVLEDASVAGAVRAGAIGYLLKDTQAEALCQAIKAAARLMQAISIPKGTEELTERETEVSPLLWSSESLG
jgi:two-component system, NarL family, response regulator LiaR